MSRRPNLPRPPTPEPYAIPEGGLSDPVLALVHLGKAVRRHVSPHTWRLITREFARLNPPSSV